MKQIMAMSPGKVGHGFLQSAVDKGLALNPDFIGADAGSTDPGPYYIGSGESFYTPYNIKRDLRCLVLAAQSHHVPLIIGNAVSTGTNKLLDMTLDLLKEIVAEEQLHLKVAYIRSEQSKETILKYMETQPIHPLGAFSDLTQETVMEATTILAQMGVEPIIKALETGADVILAGRACDDAIFAAYPIWKGCDHGLALHMGKILECGTMSCIPNDLHGSLTARLDDNGFILEPGEEFRKSTTNSVAAHTLYERDNPYCQPGPGGTNDLQHTKFEQIDARRVKVSGSKWVPAEDYTIRLEGVALVGYRTIAIGGIKDPNLIKILDDVLETVRKEVDKRFEDQKDNYTLIFRQYGRNGVMGDLEPNKDFVPNEIGLLIECVAKTQDLASSVCSQARGTIQHIYYPGIIATAGNFASPFSPFHRDTGKVFEFTIDHLVVVKDPCELFPMTVIDL